VVQLSEEQQRELDTIVEENEEGENVVIDMAGQPPMQGQVPVMNQQQQPMQQPMVQQQAPPMQQPMVQQQAPPMQQPMVQQQAPMAPQNQVIYPPQQGGLPAPNFTAVVGGFQQATFPGQGGMIVVDTSGGAMAAEGLGPMPPSGGRRTRASYHGGASAMMGAAAPPPAMPSSVMPAATGGFQNITITKLE
jgi:hypothetical protein